MSRPTPLLRLRADEGLTATMTSFSGRAVVTTPTPQAVDLPAGWLLVQVDVRQSPAAHVNAALRVSDSEELVLDPTGSDPIVLRRSTVGAAGGLDDRLALGEALDRFGGSGPTGRDEDWPLPLRGILLDRDGTVIVDVPYNGEPADVQPFPGVRVALDGVRGRGLRTGLITNQSGVARGLISLTQVHAVNERVCQLVGPFDTVQFCADGPSSASARRKPAPGMVMDAAIELDLHPSQFALIGDSPADVGAGRAAGTGVLFLVGDQSTAWKGPGPTPRCARDITRALQYLATVEHACVALP